MKWLSSFTVLVVLFSACSPSIEERRDSLDKLFQQLADANTGRLNEEAAKTYLSAAQILAKDYPTDTSAALPYYKAAEVARALGQSKTALEIYQQVIEQYPGFHKVPEARFMLAFTYDEDLNDLTSAKAAYEQFIQLHPEHTFADDAEMLLRNLGKSDEEILRELEAMQAQAAEPES
ncbi:MAG: tetratricopeptide repeat protein [Bacteroidota bacterium]